MAKSTVSHARARRNDLSADYLRSILDYDPIAGTFTWRYRSDSPNSWNAKYPGKAAGTINSYGYTQIRIGRGVYRAARLAWLWMTGEWPSELIDHRDGVGTNDAWNNLRPATYAENSMNRRSNRTGLKGTSKIKNGAGWRAVIRVGRKFIHLGTFENEQAAHAAYCEAAMRLHGDFARFK